MRSQFLKHLKQQQRIMESKYIIKPYPKNSNCPPNVSDPEGTLDVSEFFYNTIQGEGAGIGYPAVFLRLQGCTLNCQWCDTDWRRGWRYAFDEIFKEMRKHNIIDLLNKGHRLIITGGSPLKQQHTLWKFIEKYMNEIALRPIIEVENECVLFPITSFEHLVYQWNNSPKLSNSGMKRKARYKPDVIKYMSSLDNSWFKFVVDDETDWEEIQMDFLDENLIRREQIILMPLGDTKEELEKHRPIALAMSIKHSVRYSTREQVILGEL